MKILMTGGHVTPAIAVIEELQKKAPDTSIIFVGRKYTSDKDKETSFEYKSITSMKITFIDLATGRLTRIISLTIFIQLCKTVAGFYKAYRILKKEQPDKILSFGGYIGLPIALMGWLLHIPVYTHEQTIVVGIANRFIGAIARKIFISFPESEKYFDIRKTVLTGLPIRRALLTNSSVEVKNRPVLYIFGGSLGSRSINMLVETLLPTLLKKFTIYHQTGNYDFERFSRYEDQNYHPKSHLYDGELISVYKCADLVISRSGANTVMELIALCKPAILIPLPWSAEGEQWAHARLLRSSGVAEIFDQDKDNPSVFITLIDKILLNHASYISHFKNLAHYYKTNAASTIVSHLFT